MSAGLAADITGFVGNQLGGTFLAPGSPMSFACLAISLALAVTIVAAGRRGGRAVPPRVVARALFPRRIHRSASGRLDIAFFLLSTLGIGIMWAWALVSSEGVRQIVGAGLTDLLGPLVPGSVPPALAMAVTTLGLYVAYEFAYWIDHAMMHRVGWLWAFHKVHHSAESLSLLTNFRVHPVETILFYNIVALCVGTTAALLDRAFGMHASPLAIGGANLLTLLLSAGLVHLQHSHLWITFRGLPGRGLLSPAHHQLHHSADPRHYGCNLGNTMLLWDRLFGTLLTPPAARMGLRFGIPDAHPAEQTLAGALLRPFADAAAAAVPRTTGRASEA